MLYKVILLSALLCFSCTEMDLDSNEVSIKMTTSLSTLKYQEEYSIIKYELDRLFFTSNPPKRKCNIDISIEKSEEFSGMTSTTFSVNLTLILSVKYYLKCNDGLQTDGIIQLNGDLTLAQEKTVSQYVGENYITREIAKRAAYDIHKEVKIFMLLQ